MTLRQFSCHSSQHQQNAKSLADTVRTGDDPAFSGYKTGQRKERSVDLSNKPSLRRSGLSQSLTYSFGIYRLLFFVSITISL